jgi:hypothetical protein
LFLGVGNVAREQRGLRNRQAGVAADDVDEVGEHSVRVADMQRDLDGHASIPRHVGTVFVGPTAIGHLDADHNAPMVQKQRRR